MARTQLTKRCSVMLILKTNPKVHDPVHGKIETAIIMNGQVSIGIKKKTVPWPAPIKSKATMAYPTV
jgi:hypothetical protein